MKHIIHIIIAAALLGAHIPARAHCIHPHKPSTTNATGNCVSAGGEAQYPENVADTRHINHESHRFIGTHPSHQNATPAPAQSGGGSSGGGAGAAVIVGAVVVGVFVLPQILAIPPPAAARAIRRQRQHLCRDRMGCAGRQTSLWRRRQ